MERKTETGKWIEKPDPNFGLFPRLVYWRFLLVLVALHNIAKQNFNFNLANLERTHLVVGTKEMRETQCPFFHKKFDFWQKCVGNSSCS